jgi:hypothetical protein
MEIADALKELLISAGFTIKSLVNTSASASVEESQTSNKVSEVSPATNSSENEKTASEEQKLTPYQILEKLALKTASGLSI